MEASKPGLRQRFLETVCPWTFFMYPVLIFEFSLLLLALFSLWRGTLDEGTRTVLLLDFVFLGVFIPATMATIYTCRNR